MIDNLRESVGDHIKKKGTPPRLLIVTNESYAALITGNVLNCKNSFILEWNNVPIMTPTMAAERLILSEFDDYIVNNTISLL